MEYIVKKISGRFMNLEEDVLLRMKLELKSLLNSWGAASGEFPSITADDELPLWAEVEFLDDIVQFELQCNPFLVLRQLNSIDEIDGN